MPNLYIIAGCNGAGKTTASFSIFPEMLQCREFVNADEIARGISPFQPEAVAIAAGRIMLSRIDELIDQEVDFAIETTLTTKSYMKMILKAKERGYYVSLIFLWLNDVRLALARVRTRVREGGHSIPEDVIKRRYKKGIRNLVHLFMEAVDLWAIFDNSMNPYQVIAKGYANENAIVFDKANWLLINK